MKLYTADQMRQKAESVLLDTENEVMKQVYEGILSEANQGNCEYSQKILIPYAYQTKYKLYSWVLDLTNAVISSLREVGYSVKVTGGKVEALGLPCLSKYTFKIEVSW